MKSQTTIRNLSLVFLLMSVIGSGHSNAQSIDTCGALPYVGTAGPEICVTVTQNNPTITPLYFRVPVGIAPLAIMGLAAGEYTVDAMAVDYVSGPAGMAIGMAGMVTRTTAGNATLSITAIGGWGPPITDGLATITLTGDATGTSRTIVGAAAGQPAVTFPSEDVALFGFPRVIDETTLAADGFADALPPQPTPAGFETVAAQVIVAFHLNGVGTSTTIPAGVGIAPDGVRPPTVDTTAAGGKPHFECYNVKEYYPSKEEPEVKLADQFANVKTRVGRITKICTPVDKNGEGIPDPTLHLVCYKILKGHEPNRPVETKNQFGKARMHVLKAHELCVPSKKKPIDEDREQEQEPQRQEVEDS